RRRHPGAAARRPRLRRPAAGDRNDVGPLKDNPIAKPRLPVSFHQGICAMFGKGSLRPPKPFACRRRPPTRLAVEQLEERTVPSAIFTVTNLNDDGPGSLRQAIDKANGALGADAIVFQPGLAGPITLTSGELDVMDSVTITGPGAGVITVSGNN